MLASRDAEVIGISGLSFTEAGFALAASAADVAFRIEGLTAGEDVAKLGDRWLPVEGGEFQHELTLRGRWDERMFVLNEPAGTLVEARVESDNNAYVAMFDVLGDSLFVIDEGFTGTEVGIGQTLFDEPYLVVVGQISDQPGDFRLTSDQPLTPFVDLDDGTNVVVGDTIRGSIDYPEDADTFLIDLVEGEVVQFTVDSLLDTLLLIDFLGATDEQAVTDDNSGGGLFGANPEIVYQAPHTGNYDVAVADATGIEVGGYVLTVAKAP